MKSFLLDTHVFLWAISDPKKLSSQARFILERKKCNKFFSLVSIWELSIKSNLKKLKLPEKLENIVSTSVKDLGLNLLSIELPHLYKVEELKRLHGDPFERLLACQAMHEKIPIISKDEAFDDYDAVRVW